VASRLNDVTTSAGQATELWTDAVAQNHTALRTGSGNRRGSDEVGMKSNDRRGKMVMKYRGVT